MTMASDNLAGRFYSDASHFASESGNFEVQRTNHFEIVIDLAKLQLEGEGGEVYSEHLRLSTKSISAPKLTAEPLSLKHGNDTVKVAAAPSFDNVTLTVYDTIGRDQIAVLQHWFEKIFSRKTKLMGMVSSYKTNATLYMYSPDGSICRRYNLQGVWPTQIGVSDFAYDNSETATISVDLSVDRFFEESGY